MGSNEALAMLETLRNIMDENASCSDDQKHILDIYNEVRQQISDVDSKLLTVTENIAYEGKYAALDNANSLMDTISLYINYPQLIDQYVIGFFELNQDQVHSVRTRYLPAWGKNSSNKVYKEFQKVFMGITGKGGIPLSKTIPTIVVHGKEYGPVCALNMAEKNVALTPEAYKQMEGAAKKKLELTGVLSTYCLSSPQIPEMQAVVVLGKEADRRQPYYKALFQALDVLILPNKPVNEEVAVLLRSGNIKQIIAVGGSKEKDHTLFDLAVELKIELQYVDTIVQACDICDALEKSGPTHNFCNRALMEYCLCGILWYLAEQKRHLSDRMEEINSDLLTGNQELNKFLKAIKSDISKQMNRLDQCANEYYNAMQSICACVEELQQACQIEEAEETVNSHVDMKERLLELLTAEGAFLRYYKKSSAANEHIRKLQRLCMAAGGDMDTAQVLVNDYFMEQQSSVILKKFAEYKTESPLLLHKKISMYEELDLTLSACKEIILKLDSLSPLEQRLLGRAYYDQGEKEQAEQLLRTALQGGDVTAGEFLWDHFSRYNSEELFFLADHGVSQAAYQYGAELRSKWLRSEVQGLREEAMKYLNMAMAQKNETAIHLLGDIWYDQGMKELPAGVDGAKKTLEQAYQYYIALGNPANYVLERMGNIKYLQENYQAAKPFLEKAKTANACYLLGKMYENAKGVAADTVKALECYEQAVNKGHSQAQVDYDRLSKKLEAEKSRNTVTTGTSYSSSSYYTSSYYSGYYSGW